MPTTTAPTPRRNGPNKLASTKLPPHAALLSPVAASASKPTSTPARSWSLTTAERKRILLAHIHGVDIDSQAVEVTKLSLLLKVLEGERREFQGRTREMSAVLPDLSQNIQCGNSLIGHDFYQQPDLPSLDAEAKYKLNTFEWKDGFPEVMKRGGFDAVIGNPPYVRQESLKEQKSYFESHYKSYEGTADLFAYFMERSVSLLRPHGRYAIIVSSSVLRAAYAEPLRKHLTSVAAVSEIVDFGGLAVFADAKDTYVCVPILTKSTKPDNVRITRVTSLEFERLSDVVETSSYRVPSIRMAPVAWSLKSDAETTLFDKIVKAGTPLAKYVEGKIYYGIKTGLNEAFIITTAQRNELIRRDKRSAQIIKPLLGGENIRRWHLRPDDAWLIFPRRGIDITKYPAIQQHLESFRAELTPKRNSTDKKGRKPGRYAWYEIQDDVAYYEAFEGPKLIFPDICKAPRFFIDREGHYLANTAYCIGVDDLYLLGILNSRLFWFAISNISIPFGVRAGEFRYRLIYQYMSQVPIRVIEAKDKAGKTFQDKIIKLVNDIMGLHDAQAAAQTPHEKDALAKQITATDRQIDALVYQLYALTPEEIALVEGTTG